MSTSGVATIAMRGAGYYSSNTMGAKTVIDKVGDLCVGAIERLHAIAPDQALLIVDFGAADGGTSMDLMHRLIKTVRSRDPIREISIVYTDLPRNDFSALFGLTQGLFGSHGGAPLADTPNLFIFGSGTSFYRQIVASRSLCFGFSATAMHWLSHRPCAIADHVHAVGATETERQQFRIQALADWETILMARVAELHPGGRMVLVNFCIDQAGRYLGHTTGANMFDSMARHWRELFNEGRISQAEYADATFQQFYKTLDEFSAPFRDMASPVSQAGLKLEHLSTLITPCPYAEDFKKHGDAAAFAKAYVPTIRSWSETVFASALSPSRSAAERMAIIDAFYSAYEAEVARMPDQHRMDYVHCVMEISKVA